MPDKSDPRDYRFVQDIGQVLDASTLIYRLRWTAKLMTTLEGRGASFRWDGTTLWVRGCELDDEDLAKIKLLRETIIEVYIRERRRDLYERITTGRRLARDTAEHPEGAARDEQVPPGIRSAA